PAPDQAGQRAHRCRAGSPLRWLDPQTAVAMLARLLGGQSLGPEDPEGADAGGLRGRADSEGFQSSVCDSHVTGSTANKKSLVNSAFTAPTAYRRTAVPSSMARSSRISSPSWSKG
ncbi:unnamed protein product, partial [Prorocentrum cordatum]